jgi:hypothetical protein
MSESEPLREREERQEHRSYNNFPVKVSLSIKQNYHGGITELIFVSDILTNY